MLMMDSMAHNLYWFGSSRWVKALHPVFTLGGWFPCIEYDIIAEGLSSAAMAATTSSGDLGFLRPRCVNLCAIAIAEVVRLMLPHAGGIHLYAGYKES